MQKPLRTLLTLLVAVAPLLSNGQGESPGSSIILRRADYAGVLTADSAEFEVRYEIQMLRSDAEARVLLLGGPVALNSVKTSSDSVRIERSDDNVYAVVRGKGTHRIAAVAVAAVPQSQDVWKTLSFRTGPALVTQVKATADGEDSKVELVSGTTESSVRAGGKTSLTGYCGASGSVHLRWQAKVKETKVKPVILCDVGELVEVTPGVVKTTARLCYEIPQGETKSLEIAVPAEMNIVRVTGPDLRDTSIQKTGHVQVCRIELLKPVSGRYQAEVIAEQPVRELPATLEVGGITALGVDRQGGSLALVPADVVLEPGETRGMSRINAAAFSSAGNWQQLNIAARIQAAFRFPQPEHGCTITISALKSRVTVTHALNVFIGERRAQLTDALKIDVERTGIFALQLQAPEGFAVTDVKGEGVDNWKADGRSVSISFGRKVLGSQQTTIVMEQSYDALPPVLTIAGLCAPGVDVETGMAGIAPAPGIVLRDAGSTRAAPMDVLSLPAGRTGAETLAFSLPASDWTIAIKTEALKPRVSAQVFNIITVGDGFLRASATIDYAVEGAGVQELAVEIPDSWKNVDITGVDIRQKTQTGGVWRIVLQDRVLGAYSLVVTYDQAFDPNNDMLVPGALKTIGTANESGFIVITSGSHLDIGEADGTKNLTRMDARELSDRYRALIENTVLRAYGYTQQPVSLRLSVHRNKVQQPLEAVADRVSLVTVLTKSGRRETQATYLIKNNMMDSLRLVLPAGASLLTAFVDGSAVKPETDQGAIVLPLKKPEDRDRAYPVEITYVEEGRAISRWIWSSLKLAAPAANIKSSYIGWDIYLPAWIKASSFRGTVPPIAQYDLRNDIARAVRTYDFILTRYRGLLVTAAVITLVLGVIIYGVATGRFSFLKTIVLFVLLGLFAAIAAPSFMKARGSARRNACINNLRQLDAAKEEYALEYGGTNGMSITWDNVQLYVKDMQNKMFCPSAVGDERRYDLSYEIGRVGQDPQCRLCGGQDGHTLSYKAGSRGSALDMFHVHEQVAAGAEPADAMASQMSGPAFGGGLSGEESTAGLLPIRIELPRQGRVRLFSKVLNSDNGPLTIGARLVPAQTAKSLGYAICIVLILLAMHAMAKAKEHGPLFHHTLAVLLLASAAGLLFYTHDGFFYFLMLVPPTVVLATMIGLARTVARRRKDGDEDGDAETGETPPPDRPGTCCATGAGLLAALLAAATLFTGMDAAADDKAVTAPAQLQARIVSSAHEGRITGSVGSFRGTFQVDAVVPLVPGTGKPAKEYLPCEIHLLGKDVALRNFRVEGNGGELVSYQDGLKLCIARPGTCRVTVELLVPVQGDAARKRLRFALPKAVATVVRCLVDEKEAAVESENAVSVAHDFVQDGTQVSLFLGARTDVDLTWVPRMKRAREMTMTAACRSASLVHVGEGALRITSAFQYDISQGEMLSAMIRLPAEMRLLKVAGDKVLNWELKPAGDGQDLAVDFKSAAGPNDVLTIESEMPIPTVPATVSIAVPRSVGLQREVGHLATVNDQEIGWEITGSTGLQREDPLEFPADLVTGAKAGRTATPEHAFRYLQADFKLDLAVVSLQPEIKATVSQMLLIGEKETTLSAVARYDISKAGVFDLAVRLPTGYTVDSVSGDKVKKWTEDTRGQDRILRVLLSEKARGSYTLRMSLSRKREKFETSNPVLPIVPEGVVETIGYVSVGTAFGVALGGAEAQGLTEVPVAELPDLRENAVLAFKYRQAGWTLNVACSQSEPWMQASGTHVMRIGERAVNVKADFTYTIQNAPVDRLAIEVPTNAENVVISGQNIRQRDNDGAAWTVTLQRKIRQSYAVSVSFDLPRAAGAGDVPLAFARALGVEREQGFVLVCSEPSLHVREQKRTDQVLLPIDTRDLTPEVRREGGDQIRLAYRYLRQNQGLAVSVSRLDAAEVLQAIVEKGNFTTVLAEDGEMMTKAILAVRNNAKQNLTMALPENSTVWSCFVAGEAVRVAIKDGQVLIPIEQTAENEPACEIEVTYVSKIDPLKKGRRLSLSTMKPDLPMHNVRWDLYVPDGYFYGWFGGTADRLGDVSATVRQFSLAEYEEDTRASIEKRLKKAQSLISSAKDSANWGDVAGARKKFKQAVSLGGKMAEGELKKLSAAEARANAYNYKQKAEPQREQSDQPNVLRKKGGYDDDFRAQVRSNFAEIENEAGQNELNGELQVRQEASRIDDRVEETKYVQTAMKQADKIREAQEVSIDKVTPLRITLPVRGMQYAFSQALWMPGDAPVTVTMKASRIGHIGFLRAVATLILGLLALGTLTSGFLDRSRARVLCGAVMMGILYAIVLFL